MADIEVGSKVFVIMFDRIVGRSITAIIGARILKEKVSDDVWIVETIEDNPRAHKTSPKNVYTSYQRATDELDRRVRCGLPIVI